MKNLVCPDCGKEFAVGGWGNTAPEVDFHRDHTRVRSTGIGVHHTVMRPTAKATKLLDCSLGGCKLTICPDFLAYQAREWARKEAELRAGPAYISILKDTNYVSRGRGYGGNRVTVIVTVTYGKIGGTSIPILALVLGDAPQDSKRDLPNLLAEANSLIANGIDAILSLAVRRKLVTDPQAWLEQYGPALVLGKLLG